MIPSKGGIEVFPAKTLRPTGLLEPFVVVPSVGAGGGGGGGTRFSSFSLQNQKVRVGAPQPATDRELGTTNQGRIQLSEVEYLNSTLKP